MVEFQNVSGFVLCSQMYSSSFILVQVDGWVGEWLDYLRIKLSQLWIGLLRCWVCQTKKNYSLISAACKQPCCTMEVDLTNQFSQNSGKDNLTRLELRFPPTVKFYKEIRIYALFNLLAGDLWKFMLWNVSKMVFQSSVGTWACSLEFPSLIWSLLLKKSQVQKRWKCMQNDTRPLKITQKC